MKRLKKVYLKERRKKKQIVCDVYILRNENRIHQQVASKCTTKFNLKYTTPQHANGCYRNMHNVNYQCVVIA